MSSLSVEFLDEFAFNSSLIHLGKDMNTFLISQAMEKYLCRKRSLALVWQPI